MKFSLSTLKEFFDTNATVEEICSTLTNIGLEVENYEDKAKNLAQFSVAKIIEAKPHENSNKLKICLVKTSENKEPLQIICGASNARNGIKVAYAPIGSIIPSNQMVIKKAKIAGIESNGMLCSAKELAIGNEDMGIIEIDEKFEIGTKISEVFSLNDAIIEINVTPNRGDCLGVYGIARDLSATTIGKIKQLDIPAISPKFNFEYKINNTVPEACSFAVFRVLKNVKNRPSPKWLVDKLNHVGINSISAVVDITNYVMHVLNRPMHAYDCSKIKDSITIRFANQNENFTSLKNEQYLLENKILTICDNQKILSVAGIIGGLQSCCDIDSNHILLESAFFNKSSISYSGRKLNIHSESRQRFERGVDQETCQQGIEMATKLILEICGGDASEIKLVGKINNKKIIKFDFKKIVELIGINIDKQITLKILNSLGFKIDDNFNIEIPSHRHDIFSSEDIVEEIIRIYGYNKINKQELEIANNYHEKALNIHHKARLCLSSRGMIETINWSFNDDKLIEIFGKINENLILENPISSEMNHMRTSLVIGLVNSYKKNYLRNFQNLSLFEIGNIFDDNVQKNMIAGLRAGKNKEQNHYHDYRDFDIFDVKKDFFEIIDIFNIKPESLQIIDDSTPTYYHPFRSAKVTLRKNIIGYFGEIHPQIVNKFDLKNRLNFFEIFIDNIPKISKTNIRKTFISNDLPVVERDFAFIVDKNLNIGTLIKSINNIEKNLIKEINIFDIYSGANIDSNKKSVAFRVKIQSSEKTLTSNEIDDISAKIIAIAINNHQAVLRIDYQK